MNGDSSHIGAGEILRAVVFGLLLVLAADTPADTDLWGHAYFGQVMIDTRQIERTDTYSFTSDQPWINHEWLAELAMGAAFTTAGAAGLVVLKLVLLLSALGIAAWSIDQRIGNDPAGAAILLFVGWTGVLPLLSTIRPQGFSVLLMTVLTSVLASAHARPRLLWMLPPLFALWANLHGGWVMALGVLGVWLVVRMSAPVLSWRNRFDLALVGIASVLATALTPYGVTLWRFMWETVGFERADIVEWQSITALPELLLPWGMSLALGAWAVMSRRVSLANACACALLALASFRVGRLVPFFSLSVGLLLVPHIIGPSPIGRRYGRRLAAAMVTGLVVAASVVFVQGRQPTCFAPSRALDLDPEANAFIRTNQLTGRLLVWFNWGEYVIWHFSPTLKVSMDGRRETVYSKATLDAHEEFYTAAPTARAYLETLSPDFVWLPNALPVSDEIAEWGWRSVFSTPTSTIWVREADTRAFVRPSETLPPCFPGP